MSEVSKDSALSVTPVTPPLGAVEVAPKIGRIGVMMTLLLAMNTLCYLDRQIINIVAEQIRVDLDLRDWHLGALTGLSFALFYTLFSLPIARLAERMHRPTILGTALALWSVFTLFCGFAQTFGQLSNGVQKGPPIGVEEGPPFRII